MCDQSPSISSASIATNLAPTAKAMLVVSQNTLNFWMLTHFDAHFSSTTSGGTFGFSRDRGTIALT